MGKMPCTDHFHSEGCPCQPLLYKLRLAGTFALQMGSESMCKKRWFRPPLRTTFHILPSTSPGAGLMFLSTGGVGSRRNVPSLRGRSSRPLKPWDLWIPGNAEACGLLAAGQQTHPLVASRGKPPCVIRRSPASRGGRAPLPRAVCRSPSLPVRAVVGISACGPALRSLEGAIGWPLVSPRYAGGCHAGRAPSCAPAV